MLDKQHGAVLCVCVSRCILALVFVGFRFRGSQKQREGQEELKPHLQDITTPLCVCVCGGGGAVDIVYTATSLPGDTRHTHGGTLIDFFMDPSNEHTILVSVTCDADFFASPRHICFDRRNRRALARNIGTSNNSSFPTSYLLLFGTRRATARVRDRGPGNRGSIPARENVSPVSRGPTKFLGANPAPNKLLLLVGLKRIKRPKHAADPSRLLRAEAKNPWHCTPPLLHTSACQWAKLGIATSSLSTLHGNLASVLRLKKPRL
jgi:hypothetical protein